jgi:hypothetical protein
MLPRIIRALSHGDSAALLRYDGKLSHWSYVALSKADDAPFANYLGNAGAKVGVVAGPFGDVFARKAARDLGKVNGYCKYDVGVKMGY